MGIFNRQGSTLAVMDDLQIAVHTYDGCARGCPGCLVDKHFKNNMRFQSILSENDLAMIHSRVVEYYDWVRENLNTKESGYFGKRGYVVNHFSYTCRFGNHAELPIEDIEMIARTLDSPYKVFSTGPTPDMEKFITIKNHLKATDEASRLFLEIIFDPMVDSGESIGEMISTMREHDILGYPELLMTRRFIDGFTPRRFIDHIRPFGNMDVQLQFGRYSPSKTRGFTKSQLPTLDEEVEWLTEFAHLTLMEGYNLHPIPLGEYAVTLLDEYGEHKALRDGRVDEGLLPQDDFFDIQGVMEKTRDIMMTSLYIDHNLDLFIWSESMGQHVLDGNLGYAPLGNLRQSSIQDILVGNPILERMLGEIMRSMMTHRKCAPCRYKSFCASHAIPLFRKWHDDNGKHCYGYLPVIRVFQSNLPFLENMIRGFRALEF